MIFALAQIYENFTCEVFEEISKEIYCEPNFSVGVNNF